MAFSATRLRLMFLLLVSVLPTIFIVPFISTSTFIFIFTFISLAIFPFLSISS